MTKVPDGIPLQDYFVTVKIPPSNAKKLLFKTDINKSNNCDIYILLTEIINIKFYLIDSTNKMKFLVCLSLQVYIDLTKEQE